MIKCCATGLELQSPGDQMQESIRVSKFSQKALCISSVDVEVLQ